MKRERAQAFTVGFLALLFVAAIPVVVILCTVRAVS